MTQFNDEISFFFFIGIFFSFLSPFGLEPDPLNDEISFVPLKGFWIDTNSTDTISGILNVYMASCLRIVPLIESFFCQ